MYLALLSTLLYIDRIESQPPCPKENFMGKTAQSDAWVAIGAMQSTSGP
jgi:hypothetical protein